MFTRLFAFLFILSLLSCSGSSSTSGDKDRPKLKGLVEWPDKLVIEVFSNGGMSPEWDKVIVRKDSCIVEKGMMQISNRYAFVPKQNELKEVLKQMNDYSVDRLDVKEREGAMYDYPTSGFSIRMDEKFISLSSSATESVTEKNKGDFRGCYDLLMNYAEKNLDSFKKKLCITIDKSVVKSEGKLSILAEGSSSSYSKPIPEVESTVCLDLLGGKHHLQIHISRQNAHSGTTYKATLNPEIDVQNDQQLNLVLRNDSTLELK